MFLKKINWIKNFFTIALWTLVVPLAARAGLEDPLGAGGNVAEIGNRLITGALGVTGILAIIAFIWGGIEWMTSGGNTERIGKGKKMIVWAIVGLIVIFGSYAILNLIFTALEA
jgi:type IV secretory pathway VirB2 component (pilin)